MDIEREGYKLKAARLRSWMVKYGNLGVIMVVMYFSLRYVRLKSRIVLICLSIVSLFTMQYLCLYSRRPAQLFLKAAVKPIHSAASISSATTVEELAKKYDEGCRSAEKLTVGPDTWSFVIGIAEKLDHVEDELDVYKNTHLVLKLLARDLGGLGLTVKRMTFPINLPIVAVQSFPGLGHPSETHFYTIIKSKLVTMGKVGAEYGGPIFRDYDGDGKQEWVFDDYRWYDYFSQGPTRYLVYKQDQQGKLRLWKRIPNPKHEHLPDNIHIFCY